jgi:Resolvase, N terminal domain
MAKADRARTSTIRCAIYTRKSSDEGLEQEFNSLDAQREACEAYIVSQRHAGWVALADMYDDGGLSGGKMERPALKRLLEDIKATRRHRCSEDGRAFIDRPAHDLSSHPGCQCRARTREP